MLAASTTLRLIGISVDMFIRVQITCQSEVVTLSDNMAHPHRRWSSLLLLLFLYGGNMRICLQALAQQGNAEL